MSNGVLTTAVLNNVDQQVAVMDALEFAHLYHNDDWWIYKMGLANEFYAKMLIEHHHSVPVIHFRGKYYCPIDVRIPFEGFHREALIRYKNMRHLRNVVSNFLHNRDVKFLLVENMYENGTLPCKYFILVRNLARFL